LSSLLQRLALHPVGTDLGVLEETESDHGAGTYGAVGARSRSLAAQLRGVRTSLAGARIAFLAPPSRGYVDTLLGILLAGGTAVPLSPLHTSAELAHVIRVAQPEVLITTNALADKLEPVREGLPVVVLDRPRKTVFAHDAEPNDAAPAIMLFTSGTTGKPKGVVLSHAGVAATLGALEEAWQWKRTDRLLHVLPLHHTHGVVVALLGAFWAGAEVRFATFDPKTVFERLAHSTVMMMVPPMVAKLVEALEAAEPAQRASMTAALRSMRLFTCGSAALPASLHARFAAATGHAILERYGMTEIGMALSNPYVGERAPGLVGTELPHVAIDLCDEAGKVLPRGEPGELRVRSPQMFTGYFGDSAATAAAFDAEGRFQTGDVGVRDERGYVRLLGRASSDILKSGGYKISALEIEEVLRAHPDVGEVAVIGTPDETWGDIVTACIVVRAGREAPTLEALKEFAAKELAPYKLPRALRVLSELPRNAMGKVQKQALRAP